MWFDRKLFTNLAISSYANSKGAIVLVYDASGIKEYVIPLYVSTCLADVLVIPPLFLIRISALEQKIIHIACCLTNEIPKRKRVAIYSLIQDIESSDLLCCNIYLDNTTNTVWITRDIAFDVAEFVFCSQQAYRRQVDIAYNSIIEAI